MNLKSLLCRFIGHDDVYGGDGHRGLFPWWRCVRCQRTTSFPRSARERDLDSNYMGPREDEG